MDAMAKKMFYGKSEAFCGRGISPSGSDTSWLLKYNTILVFIESIITFWK